MINSHRANGNKTFTIPIRAPCEKVPWAMALASSSGVCVVLRCVDCMIYHERDVREEQKYMYVARTSNNRVIPME